MGFWRTSEEREARDDRMEALHLARHQAELERRAAGLEWFPENITFVAFGPDEPLFKTLEQLQAFCHITNTPEVHTAMTKKAPVYPRAPDPNPNFVSREIKYVQLDDAAKQWIEFCTKLDMGQGIDHEKWEDAGVKRPGKQHLTPFPIILWGGGPVSSAEQLRDLARLEAVPVVKKHAAFGLVEGQSSERMSSARYCYVGFEAVRVLAGCAELKTVGSWIPGVEGNREARVVVRLLESQAVVDKPLEGYFDFATISNPLHEAPDSGWKYPVG